ncbi:MAG: hypothetical protein FWE09_03130 [Treponema sp.]|nr:hypothetical protein [Treponema sp.]
MEDVKKIEVIGTIRDGIAIGAKNIGPILVNVILWVLTIWIPYLNVGTTIGLVVGIVAKASRGEAISFTEIFDARYRKYMGEYFLVSGLVFIGAFIGLAFFVIPGLVISMAWMFAPMLTVDKGKNPMEAITLSNNITYGNKGRIFCIELLVAVVFGIVIAILSFIPVIGPVLAFAVTVFLMFVWIGINASLYRQFAANV